MSSSDSGKEMVEPTSPFFMGPSENPGVVLIPAVLTGDNYAGSTTTIQLALSAKNKLEFIDGTIKKPATTSKDFKSWKICNDMVVSWITNSLYKGLQASMTYVVSAREMCLELQERYLQGNTHRVYELKNEMSRLEQGADSVVNYYNKLKVLRDELDEYTVSSACSCEGCTYGAPVEATRENEVEKLHQFLMGLETETYGDVVSQILNTDPLPMVSKAFSQITQEEKRRSVPRRAREHYV